METPWGLSSGSLKAAEMLSRAGENESANDYEESDSMPSHVISLQLYIKCPH